MNAVASDSNSHVVRSVGLWLGPVLAVAIQLLPMPAGLDSPSWVVASLAILMAVWWITEAIPIPVTALLPLVVLPLAGVMPIAKVSTPYSSPIVLMLLGGFIIATSIERWRLHSRIALNIVLRAGTSPSAIVGGFIVAGAMLSMWISNSATTIMLAPIAVSVAYAIIGPKASAAPLTVAILLGLAYGASIGGIATPIGTPTNLIVIGYLEAQVGVSISFAQWMGMGVPVVALMLPACWLVVTRLGIRLEKSTAIDGQEVIREKLTELGAMSVPERRVLIVFTVVALAWMLRQPLTSLDIGGIKPFSGLTDHVIAIAGAIVLFLVPAGEKEEPKARLLDWESASRIPWGVLVLFGGGLSLANAITKTQLSGWLGESLVSLTSLPSLVLLVALVTVVIFATEMVSNIATASALLPVIGALAVAGGVDPLLLSLPIAMAASCAFMLPIATGPNAIVFATGEVSIPTMARIGLMLNVCGIALIPLVIFYVAPHVFSK